MVGGADGVSAPEGSDLVAERPVDVAATDTADPTSELAELGGGEPVVRRCAADLPGPAHAARPMTEMAALLEVRHVTSCSHAGSIPAGLSGGQGSCAHDRAQHTGSAIVVGSIG